MSVLEVKNLNLGFHVEDKFYQALYDVNYSLEAGKMLSLVGESGCGKSMSAMSILNLLPKTAEIVSGEILFNGNNLLKMNNDKMQKIRGKEIALIPQDPMTSLNPLYTIGNQLFELINVHQNLYGKDAEDKAVEVLDMVQIPNAKSRLKSYPYEFSGGMKQRVIIAMALVCNSKIIIADEPTTALDVTIQQQIMNLLNDIKKEKDTAILLITHDLALVSQYADDVAVMYSGRIVEKTTNEILFKNPVHPYTKSLLNSLPTDNKSVLSTIQGQPPTLTEQITGCKFNPRCSNCTEICKIQVPKLIEISENHYVSCFNN